MRRMDRRAFWHGALAVLAMAVLAPGVAGASNGSPTAEHLRLVDLTYDNVQDRFEATMEVNRGQYEASDSQQGRGAMLALTVIAADGRTKHLEPICAPLHDATLLSAPQGGTVRFIEYVAWDGRADDGTVISGHVLVDYTGQLVAGHPDEHRPIGSPSTGTMQVSVASDPIRVP